MKGSATAVRLERADNACCDLSQGLLICQKRRFSLQRQASARIPTYRRLHPQGCRRSLRSDKGCMLVLIRMFLDGGCDYGL
uniref:Uncharacterized protein n=1 Tax=Medicago truncatula TaxID=3880 RepID=A2Q3N7_MEDTR|nr:hypothetical protein MtrDRAFT_AC155886g15v2 [Medicago truncatula]